MLAITAWQVINDLLHYHVTWPCVNIR